MTRSVPRQRARIGWYCGTRSEVLRLGPLYQALRAHWPEKEAIHWFAYVGEQGMAGYQAMDFLDVHPTDEYELRYRAEDPAIRLYGLMIDIEENVRRNRISRLVFSGFGPTAAASALVAHGRGSRGLWIRPRDPAGLIPRLRWERGLERVVASLGEAIDVMQAPEPAKTNQLQIDIEIPAIAGRREGAPLVFIAVTRMLWGMNDVLDQVVDAAATWARETPDADWLIMRSLDPRLEGPLNHLRERPKNLLSTPPLRYPEYLSVLNDACIAFTDSCHIAAEFLDSGKAVVALGEAETTGAPPARVYDVTPQTLALPKVLAFVGSYLSPPIKDTPPASSVLGLPESMVETLRRLLVPV